MAGIDFSHMPCISWGNITKASYLQRRILVHSILYYEMASSVITDNQFNAIGHQLVELRNAMDEESYSKTTYYYVFTDFDASTGFYLYGRLNKQDREYLELIAQHVLRRYNESRKAGK